MIGQGKAPLFPCDQGEVEGSFLNQILQSLLFQIKMGQVIFGG